MKLKVRTYRYICLAAYIVVILTIRYFSHTAFDVLITLSVSGVMADRAKLELLERIK